MTAPAPSLFCACATSVVRVRRVAGDVARFLCAGCGSPLRDVAPSDYAYRPRRLGASAPCDMPAPGDPACWLGYARCRSDGGEWVPVALARSLDELWDALLTSWVEGDVLAVVAVPQTVPAPL